MSKLFSPYEIKDVTIKNRIVMSPMCMYTAVNKDGRVENWHLTHYGSRAMGQVGLIMVEATSVTIEGRVSEYDLGIWSDTHVNGLCNLVKEIKDKGAVSGIQLAHGGRKAFRNIVGPSPIPFAENYKIPREMKVTEIAETIQAFKQGARRAKAAGFDIIEIHAAHGYLINEFLSPLSNKRTDEYGGSLKNNYRFLKEIIIAVKEVWNGPLFVRISASDYHPEGLDLNDYFTYVKWLKEDGVDLVDVSSGAIVPIDIPVYPGYQIKFSESIKKTCQINTGTVGLITSGVQAEEILRNERADLIFIGRELLRNPYWPRIAARELNESIEVPMQYIRGW